MGGPGTPTPSTSDSILLKIKASTDCQTAGLDDVELEEKGQPTSEFSVDSTKEALAVAELALNLQQINPCDNIQENDNKYDFVQKQKDNEEITKKQIGVLHDVDQNGIFVGLNTTIKEDDLDDPQKSKEISEIERKDKKSKAISRWGMAGEMGMDVYMVKNECIPIQNYRICTLMGEDKNHKPIKAQGIDGLYIHGDGYIVYVGEAKYGTSQLGTAQDDRLVEAYKRWLKKNPKNENEIKDYKSIDTLLKKIYNLNEKNLSKEDEEAQNAQLNEYKALFKYKQLSNLWILDRIEDDAGENCGKEIEKRMSQGLVYAFVFRLKRKNHSYNIYLEHKKQVKLADDEVTKEKAKSMELGNLKSGTEIINKLGLSGGSL